MTLPFLSRFAHKIGAEFNIIDRPVFNEASVTYEKFQLYERSKGYDWTYFIDADALVHPECPDWTDMLDKCTVCFGNRDMSLNRFRGNGYVRRSKILHGACTWLTVFSDWCRDLWHPMQETTFAECVENIFPAVHELASGECRREHLIDDYIVTQNIARYGLKATTTGDLCALVGKPPLYYFHLYACSTQHKAEEIRKMMTLWKL